MEIAASDFVTFVNGFVLGVLFLAGFAYIKHHWFKASLNLLFAHKKLILDDMEARL